LMIGSGGRRREAKQNTVQFRIFLIPAHCP
jgi:hypothetical protein